MIPKFRVWDKTYKKLGLIDADMTYRDFQSLKIDNFILMQSTGGTQEVEEDFGSVRIYRGFNLYLGGGYPNAVMSEFEVVGNIYENPELVEVIDD